MTAVARHKPGTELHPSIVVTEGEGQRFSFWSVACVRKWTRHPSNRGRMLGAVVQPQCCMLHGQWLHECGCKPEAQHVPPVPASELPGRLLAVGALLGADPFSDSDEDIPA